MIRRYFVPFLWIGFLFFALAGAEGAPISQSSIRLLLDAGSQRSDTFSSITDCTSKRDAYQVEFPDFQRTDCFISEGEGYIYFLYTADKAGTISLLLAGISSWSVNSSGSLQAGGSGALSLSWSDQDGDWLFDWFEEAMRAPNGSYYTTRDSGVDTSKTGPNDDPDNDGLTNIQEQQYGSNPFRVDTDGDGYSDGTEVRYGSDPNNSSSRPLDSDHDGLTDEFEAGMMPPSGIYYLSRDPGIDITKTGPNDDPDGDGYTNLQEQQNGTNPFKKDRPTYVLTRNVAVVQDSLANIFSGTGTTLSEMALKKIDEYVAAVFRVKVTNASSSYIKSIRSALAKMVADFRALKQKYPHDIRVNLVAQRLLFNIRAFLAHNPKDADGVIWSLDRVPKARYLDAQSACPRGMRPATIDEWSAHISPDATLSFFLQRLSLAKGYYWTQEGHILSVVGSIARILPDADRSPELLPYNNYVRCVKVER